MKDRRNNMEIMDVLSSIRRLVSEDRKAAAQKAEPAVDEATPREEPPLRRQPEHRFVLTESLRVSEEVEAEPAMPSAESADDVTSLEETIAELEAAVAGLAAGFEPDAGEVHENMAAELASDWVAEDIIRRRPDVTPVLGKDDLPRADDGAASFAVGGSVAAGLEAAMSAQPRAGRLTPTAPDAAVVERDQIDPPQSTAEEGGRLHFSSSAARRPMILRSGEDDIGGQTVHEETPPPPNDPAPETPVAVAEGLVTAGLDGMAGPNSASDDAFSVVADGDEASASSAHDADELFNPLAGTGLDMDVLHDLVAEIVRDELRGALGDGITRNLRAMVRREIERALEAQGLKRL